MCFKVADLPTEQERLLNLGVKFDGQVLEGVCRSHAGGANALIHEAAETPQRKVRRGW
jgi:hypothetical protein